MQSKHTMSHIFQTKKLETRITVAKTLIEYNSNCLEENKEEKEEKEPIDIEFT